MSQLLTIFFLELLPAVIDMLICMTFFHMMYGTRKAAVPYSLWLLSYIGAELPLVFNSLFFQKLPRSDLAILICSLTSLLGLFLVSFEYQASMRHRIFSVLSFQIMAGVSEALSSFLFELTRPGVDMAYNAFYLSKIILCIFVFVIGTIYTHMKRTVTFRYSLLLTCLPVLSFFILYLMLGETFSATAPYSFFVRIIISAALICICLMNYYLLNIQFLNRELDENRRFLEQQTQRQKRQYEQTMDSYKELRRIIHDTKKHLLYIRECAFHQKDEQIISYINDSLDELDYNRLPVNTGNLAIDAIISSTIYSLKAMECQLTTNIQLDASEIPVSDHDLCIILGNMTDNCLDAVRKIPRGLPLAVTLELFMSRNQLVFHLVNSCVQGPEGIYDPTQISMRSDLPIHGYGLYNIHTIVQKYDGLSRFEQKQDCFDSSVIIPLKRKETFS